MSMSRFYAGQSSSDSDSDSSSDNEEFAPTTTKTRNTFFLPSDDEEEVRHVVRSPKEKADEALQSIIKLMQNAQKIDDMSKLQDQFDNLCKTYQKHKNVFQKSGVPRYYVKCLVETNDYVKAVWEDSVRRKKMSRQNSKSHNTLKYKLKKYLADFTKEIENFNKNPESEDEEEVKTKKDEESDDEEAATQVKPSVVDFLKDEVEIPARDAGGDDEDSDSSYWDSSSDDDSDEDDGSKQKGVLTAEFFLKSNKDKTQGKEKRKPRTDKKEVKQPKKKEEKWEEVRAGGKVKTTLFEKGTEVTHVVAMKKLTEIMSNRGRRSTDRHEQVALLKELQDICKANDLGKAIQIRIDLDMILAYFDYNSKILDYMKVDAWGKLLTLVEDLLTMLLDNPDIKVSPSVARESENVSDEAEGYQIYGDLVVMVDKLHREYTKIFQNVDAHSTEYVTPLRQEPRIINIIKLLKRYMEDVDKDTQNICASYLLLAEYIYYKYDAASVAGQASAEEDSTQVLKKLCEFIYTKDSTARLRTRAILLHIYHHCLHDRWYEARDLMLMSHLQENISFSDIPTQIIYNRTMVQLGLCAFRQGLMKDAHSCLVDIQSTGRAKELLAQGLLLQRQGERISAEQEKKEKRRQMPFHQHINLEQLECVYLVAAMLLEIPYVAAHEFDARRRMISKQYHHQLRVSERQTILGPPDNMREHIVAASKKLKMGDYSGCFELVVNDKMKSKVWNLFHKRDHVIDMLKEKIKEASLCCYLVTYSQFYDCMSLERLARRFELDKDSCHRVISRLIINDELAASWDEPAESLVLHKTEPTRLQNMVVQMSEKIALMLEFNERILDSRQSGGGGGYQGYRGGGGGNQDRNYRNNQDNRNYRSGGGDNRGYQGGGNRRYNNNNSHGGGYRGQRQHRDSTRSTGSGGGYNRSNNNYHRQRA